MDTESKRDRALAHFGFNPTERTLLILGGSLGSRTINQSILAGIDKLIDAQVQVIWQTGKFYFGNIKDQTDEKDLRRIRIHDFLTVMGLA